MRVVRKIGEEELIVLAGMARDHTVLSRVAAKWPEQGLFRGRWANLVGGWCVDYFSKYGRPPAESLEAVCGSWCEACESKEAIRAVSALVEDVVDTSQRLDAEYVLDLAGRHFQAVALERLSDGIRGDLGRSDVQRAMSRVSSFEGVRLGEGAGIDLFQDREVVEAAFDDPYASLIEYPGALGSFLDGVFTRDAFVAFMGAVNAGKSWWLMDVAWRAMKQKLRVAFFETGDMSQHQIVRRLMVRAACHPVKPAVVKKPVAIKRIDDKTVEVESKEIEYKSALSIGKAWAACQRVTKGRKGSYFRLSVHPNSSIGVDGIRSIISEWERTGWVPDVVVIDYSDLLAPRPGIQDTREKINDTWKGLRRLSQELHCLVVTATQADANSYTAHLLTRSNFTDTRQKIDHVTAMLGINRTLEDEQKGYCRLNIIKLRDGEYRTGRVVYVATCYALGNPAAKSCF